MRATRPGSVPVHLRLDRVEVQAGSIREEGPLIRRQTSDAIVRKGPETRPSRCGAEGSRTLTSPPWRVRSWSIPLGKAVDRRGTRAARCFPARPFSAFMLGICWGNQTLRMPAFEKCRLTWAFSGPEEIRTPDLTRARGALYQLSYWPEGGRILTPGPRGSGRSFLLPSVADSATFGR